MVGLVVCDHMQLAPVSSRFDLKLVSSVGEELAGYLHVHPWFGE